LDLQVFDTLLGEGRAAAGRGRLTDAADRYRRALELWHGPPLGGMNSRLLRAVATRLTERHLALVEENAEIQLQLGNHHDVIGELRALVAAHPVRERLRAQLMTALYRAGRQAEALAEYQQARQTLVTELGLEPGPSLRQLERAILTGAANVGAVPAGPVASAPTPSMMDATASPHLSRPPAPRLLPPDVADLTGHGAAVARLCGPADPAPRSSAPAAPVTVVSGMAGVGKTTLAVHAAHRRAADFPDGQLFVSLYGSEPRPVRPMLVLGRFLRALGVLDQHLPGSLDERAELYRDRLAGRRMLIVLDDAASEEQILPLLPSAGPAAVLITSRRRLPGLAGAHLVELAALDPRSATELLAQLAGAERVEAEPEATRELVRLCDGLPLALHIAGARLADRPHWTVRRLVTRLADERHRLDELTYGGLGVRQRIAPAYQLLGGAARQLFRRLALLPVDGFSDQVNALPIEADPRAAEDALEALVDARLLAAERVDDRTVRYRFPELIRLYARERLAAEEPAELRRDPLVRLTDRWRPLAIAGGSRDVPCG
jgi:hypothetical protein